MNAPAQLTEQDMRIVANQHHYRARRAALEAADPVLFARVTSTADAVSPAQTRAQEAWKAMRAAIANYADAEDIAHLTREYRAACDASMVAWFAMMDALEESWARGFT